MARGTDLHVGNPLAPTKAQNGDRPPASRIRQWQDGAREVSWFVYRRPTSLPEAVELLGRPGSGAKVLAGGQSLLSVMALRLGQREHLVDISRLRGLDLLGHDGGIVRVGATVTHAEVEDAPMIRPYAPLLADAMPWIAHRRFAIAARCAAASSMPARRRSFPPLP